MEIIKGIDGCGYVVKDGKLVKITAVEYEKGLFAGVVLGISLVSHWIK